MRSPSSSSSSTTTASGSSTRALTRNSSSSVTGPSLAAGGGDALGAQQPGDRLGGLGAVLEPVARALLVELDQRRVGLRVVLADRRDRPAVARGALVGDDDAPDRVLLGTHSSQSYPYGHERGEVSAYAPWGAAPCRSSAPAAACRASCRWPSSASSRASGRTA